jgi:hypothetical protein
VSRNGDRHDDKTCLTCGRRITWRKKWERSWDQVRYCGDGCRRRGVRPDDERLEAAMLERLAGPDGKRGIDPEEVGAAVTSRDGKELVDLKERSRNAARRLVAKGLAALQQAGRDVDPSTARGPLLLVRAK